MTSPPRSPQRMMLDKLATSLITSANARELKLQAMSETEVAKQLPELSPHLSGFKIPYFGLDRKLRPDGFFRFRFLGKPSNGWASQGEQKKPRRYGQLAGSGVAAYLSPTVPWVKVAADTKQPICITEGELKAICCCLHMVPTIGLGGVNNFRTKHMDLLGLVPELEAIDWKDRVVVVLFDSDILTKPEVRAAATMLAAALEHRGAIVKLTSPPAVSGDKTGVDDWLYSLGGTEAKRTKALEDLIDDAPEMDTTRQLHKLNTELARVRLSADYVELATGWRFGKQQLLDESRFSHRKIRIEDGEGGVKVVQAVKHWLGWPYAHTINTYTYEPGQPALTDNGYNLWPGWAVEPAKGAVEPFFELMESLVGNASKADQDWLFSWLAYPLQNPGAKMHSGVLMWGAETGTGKTMLANTMRRIYGKNFGVIESKHLQSNFNSFLNRKQFILGDEISVTDKRQISEKLKALLTQETVWVEEKYQIPFEVQDTCNYYFTSNYPDAFYVEDKDRRFFIHEVTSKPMANSFSDQYFEWLDNKGGAAALFYHLLHERPLGHFDPKARPPITVAKESMIMLGHNDLRRWIEELKVQAATDLRHIYTISQLMAMYAKENPNAHIDRTRLGRELSKADVKAVSQGKHLRIAGESGNIRAYIFGESERETHRLHMLSPKEGSIAVEAAIPTRQKFASKLAQAKQNKERVQ